MKTVIISVVFSFGIFFGGFFLGRYEPSNSNSCASNSAASSSASTQYTPSQTSVQISYGGATVLNAINGVVPAQDFMSCLMVPNPTLTNPIAISCMPENAIVTPPQSIMLTLYQFQSITSLIVTATGSNYGGLSTSSSKVEANFTLIFNGLNAEESLPHVLPGMSTYKNANGQFVIPITLRDTDTVNIVLTNVNISPSFMSTFYVSGSPNDLNFYVMGAVMHPMFLGRVTPTMANPVMLSYPLSTTPASSFPAAASFQTIPEISDSSVAYYRSTSSIHRRSISSDDDDSTGAVQRNNANNMTFGVYAAELLGANGQATHRLEVHRSRGAGLGLTVNVTMYGTPTAYHTIDLVGNSYLDLKQHSVINATNLMTLIQRHQHGNSTATLLQRTTMVANGGKVVRLVGTAVVPVWVIAVLKQFGTHASAKAQAIQTAHLQRRISWGCVYDVLKSLGDSVGCVNDVISVISTSGADLLDPFFDWDMVSGCWGACEDWVQVWNSC